VALQWLKALPWREIEAHERRLVNTLLEGLLSIEGLTLLGEQRATGRAPIFSFDIEGCHPHDVCQVLDDYGVALRGGHHCAQPLMDALDLVATSRASLALFNNAADVEALLQGLRKAVKVLR
jgi:cysteine desulfurase/selenocysteine lyase